MVCKFKWRGGAVKSQQHRLEKFMLFFLVNGNEVPFYQMKENSLVVQVHEKDEDYWQCVYPIVKVFVSEQGFGIRKRYYSFYIRMGNAFPLVTLKPFSVDKTGYFFQAQGSFISNKAAIKLLGEGSESARFVSRQGMLPVDTLRKMITIDKTVLRKGIRAIRIGKGGGKK